MPSPTFMNRDTLLPALNQGTMPVAVLDDKVRRILRKAIEFGFFDQPQTDIDPSYLQSGRTAGGARNGPGRHGSAQELGQSAAAR